ncbi:MAG: high-affinity nickel-transporter, partial [bacterium]
EITTFQELQKAGAKDANSPTEAELNLYLEKIIPEYISKLTLTVNDKQINLEAREKTISTALGAGELKTLRVECYLTGQIPSSTGLTYKVHFQDTNHPDRLGWHEMVVTSESGASIFNSTAFGSAVTDEIKAYPEDALVAPLNERSADFYFTFASIPSDGKALLTRQGQPTVSKKDPLTDLALWGLLIAGLLGGLHALSPGHGKTIVAAYLVGNKGTIRHALFLGFTVTVTHTVGVFALGLITLFASQYIIPERIFPILSFISGSVVVLMGLSLFFTRLSSFLGIKPFDHSHNSGNITHSHWNLFSDHSHNEKDNSHLPPGMNGEQVTWRNLLALGISGGLLPCPSPLVVLLAAIALHRVAYGLLLVLVFSIGLATVLTLVGIAFVYAGKLFKNTVTGKYSRIIELLPIVSAIVITTVGTVICYQALVQAGINVFSLFQHFEDDSLALKSVASLGILGILILGLIFGLKHATEADHVVAVSTIVSEHKSLLKAASVGVLWGLGHTVSLLVVGLFVLGLRLTIPEFIASWLEFSVSLMIIGLGANAFISALREKPVISTNGDEKV